MSALGGVSAVGGCLLLGVSSLGGCLLWGCLLWGVSGPRGCLLLGVSGPRGCLLLGVSALGGARCEQNDKQVQKYCLGHNFVAAGNDNMYFKRGKTSQSSFSSRTKRNKLSSTLQNSSPLFL